jgi:hypothetical protein
MWIVRGAESGISFREDAVWELISYHFKSEPWTDKIVAIAHNAKDFGLQFVRNRLVRFNLLPNFLVMNGQKIMCLKVEGVMWLGSLTYMTMPILKLPEAFRLR